MINRNNQKLFFIILFGIAMGYFEAALVVYLRELFYPEGFALPLRIIPRNLIVIELFREAATIVMLVSVAALTARKFWERFGYFILMFGIWDIFYYVFLKVTLNWPASFFDWDILFLIPLPWIGPVIAPVLISILMIIIGIMLISLYEKGGMFKLTKFGLITALLGTALILYSFMSDLEATIHLKYPGPYRYWLFAIGYIMYFIAFRDLFGGIFRKVK
jgi:hypothetical protein